MYKKIFDYFKLIKKFTLTFSRFNLHHIFYHQYLLQENPLAVLVNLY